MNYPVQLAKHLHEVYFGGNWTCSDFEAVISGITWQQAITKIGDLNTIATLVYHIGYYTAAQRRVLEGAPLEASDTESFLHSPVNSAADWDALLETVRADAKALTALLKALPEEQLGEIFVEEKYGSYFRNIAGNIEHFHYHLGQIAIIKKLVRHD